MRICVTGGAGFIGRALVHRLLADGHEVRVLSRPSPRADALESRGAEVVRGELNDHDAALRAVHDAHVVFHAAAKVRGPGSREEFMQANVKGTQHLLEACRWQDVRQVVYLSSIAVYGVVKQGEVIDESTPFDEAPEERDFYAQSKIAADQLAMSFATNGKLSMVILRPGIVYGPGKPLPIALLGFRMGRTSVIFGSPDQRFPLNYIENLVDALVLAMNSSPESLRQYVIVDDDNLTLGQYHQIKSHADNTGAVFLPGWPVLVGGPLGGIPRHQVRRALQNRRYSSRRIGEELGWSPKIGLQEAIERTLERSE